MSVLGGNRRYGVGGKCTLPIANLEKRVVSLRFGCWMRGMGGQRDE